MLSLERVRTTTVKITNKVACSSADDHLSFVILIGLFLLLCLFDITALLYA